MSGVDVLAVMDELLNDYQHAATYIGEWCFGLDDDLVSKAKEARAAVLELKEAASDPLLEQSPTDSNWEARAKAVRRLDAALARIGGES